VIQVPLFVSEIDQFDPGTRRHDEIRGGPARVTAVVEPVTRLVRRELVLHLAGFKVVSDDVPSDLPLERLSHQTVPSITKTSSGEL